MQGQRAYGEEGAERLDAVRARKLMTIRKSHAATLETARCKALTTGDIYAKDDFGEENVEEYNKGADAVMALTSGKIDAVIIDNQPAKSFVETTDGLQILDTDYVQEDYAAAIQKGNTDLLNAVNGALKELKEDGTIQKILDKYIK